ncbi:hypothetical protein LCGC14_1464240 [marine sediment metagenome]|uniref:Putative exodeoxyribonuclease 8 PDDEXK-like domain-containing protein n=1 Tax=marine sediment metagenome TaxID=412755 RepID=A0A0F9LUR6_9ZZZZ
MTRTTQSVDAPAQAANPGAENSGAARCGIFYNIPFTSYVEIPAMNHSALRSMAKSPLHFKWDQDHPRPSTRSMEFGTLGHEGILDPLGIAKKYAVVPEAELIAQLSKEYKAPKATKAYKELLAKFQAANVTRTIVEQDDYDRMVGMAEAVQADARTQAYLTGHGKVEVTILWKDCDTGLILKGRLDKWRSIGLIIDLKTTRDASRAERSIWKYGYHIQAAMYVDGVYELTGEHHEFVLIFVESEPPYGIRAAKLHESAIELGRETYKRLLHQYAQCQATNEWPGYDHPIFWRLPEWAAHEHKPPATRKLPDVQLTAKGVPIP